MDFLKKTISAGLGAIILTEEKIKETVDELVKKGEVSNEESKSVAKEILDRVNENKKFVTDKVTEEFDKFVKKANIATTGDLEKLEKRIEKLESLLKEKNTTAK